jgi:hypothetical protein
MRHECEKSSDPTHAPFLMPHASPNSVMFGAITVALLLAASAALAQSPAEAWRTVRTAHFRVHYPVRMEAWSLRAASRLESVRDAVVAEVGYAPKQITDVVVMNPVADPNGVTLPLLDAPRIVLYAEPPQPETEIGEYHDWIDLLTVHETTHLVHLLRPSRNPAQRLLTHILPLSPITLGAPRWVLEGYATLVEGRLTGSGRPIGSLRAAVLRKWAQTGQLPTYAQVAGDRRFFGGSMAYLMGSAYLEWLEQRAGAGSLRALWARLTARQRRGFESAFRGVFGDSPQRLYGEFTAELIESARTVARAEKDREGELWMETTHNSGDPAVSPDGKHLALVLRNAKRESRLAIVSTGPNEEEAKLEKRVAEMLRRDPEDVAPVRAKPLPRKPEHTYMPDDGGDVESPRWTRDGASIIFTHKQPDRGGFLHHDLFRWTPSTGATARITHLADVSDADPLPGGRDAVAVRSRDGFSQLVRVNLTGGEVTPMNDPRLDRVYSHPRASADGRIAWAEHTREGWRVVVDGVPVPDSRRQPATGNQQLRYGAYAPEWTAGGTLVTTVAGGGFIEIAALTPAGDVPVTRSSGASAQAAPSPDGALFFMGLDPDGWVVRRLPDLAPAPSRQDLAFERSMVPALPPDPAVPVALRSEPVSPHPYGLGRQEWSTLFGGQYTSHGSVQEIGVRAGDVAGKLDAIAVLARDRGITGGALAATWRGWPVATTLHLFRADRRRGAELRGAWEGVFPLARLSVEAGVQDRAFMLSTFTLRQRRVAAESVTVAADTRDHLRATARASLHLGDYRVGGAITAGRRMSVGGFATSIEPDAFLTGRILDPALDRDAAFAPRYRGARLEIGSGDLTAFWQRHHTAANLDVAGIETTFAAPPMPLLKTAALHLTAGIARVRQQRATRAWLALHWRP